MNFKDKPCVPCEDENFPALTPEQAQEFLPHVPGWSMSPTATHLTRSFAFPDFKEALAFANAVGVLAEEAWHHPDMVVGWGRVAIDLTTHSIGGLSENDFILAARINALQEEKGVL